jgi:hypothetical protein
MSLASSRLVVFATAAPVAVVDAAADVCFAPAHGWLRMNHHRHPEYHGHLDVAEWFSNLMIAA